MAGRIKTVKTASGARWSLRGIKGYADILIDAALAEDVGAGDITTRAVVPEGLKGECRIRAKEDCILAGLFIAGCVFKKLDRRIRFKASVKDGEKVQKGGVVATISGRLAPILIGERVALNFLQRLSGIATLTSRFVKGAAPSKVKVLDTRKTTPCMRRLERYAVKMGGGYNHRFGLFDAVLIKDNHIKAAGGVREAVERVNKMYKEAVTVEVEVTNLAEAGEAAAAGVEIIMLDNMGPDRIRKALKVIQGRALVEVSGGVTLKNITRIAATGVDFISVGALTHSVPAVDMSMEVVRIEGKR